jgi:hypothetical protein
MAKAPDVQKDEFQNKEKCPWSIAIHQRWNSPEIILRTSYDHSLTLGAVVTRISACSLAIKLRRQKNERKMLFFNLGNAHSGKASSLKF